MDLARISDRLEIEALLVRYTRAIDTGDVGPARQVFTPDAEIDYTSTGGIAASLPRGEAVAGRDAADLPAPDAHARPGRQPASTATTAHRSRRTSTTRWCCPSATGRDHLVEFGGIYHHDLVRTPDGWRSRRLVEELVWKRGM